MTVDINDLEQQQFKCWNILEDLDELFEGVCERDLTRDEIANIILGLRQLYELKFEKHHRMMGDLYEERRQWRAEVTDLESRLAHMKADNEQLRKMLADKTSVSVTDCDEDCDEADCECRHPCDHESDTGC